MAVASPFVEMGVWYYHSVTWVYRAVRDRAGEELDIDS